MAKYTLDGADVAGTLSIFFAIVLKMGYLLLYSKILKGSHPLCMFLILSLLFERLCV